MELVRGGSSSEASEEGTAQERPLTQGALRAEGGFAGGVRFAHGARSLRARGVGLRQSSRLYYDEGSVVRPERGNNSVVECDLAKVEVAGSNPVSRSIFFFMKPAFSSIGSRCCRLTNQV